MSRLMMRPFGPEPVTLLRSMPLSAAMRAAIGETIRARMQAWQERWDAIGDVRGLGAMLAIELVHDRETKNPAPDLATKVVEAASERGLASAAGEN